MQVIVRGHFTADLDAVGDFHQARTSSEKLLTRPIFITTTSQYDQVESTICDIALTSHLAGNAVPREESSSHVVP